MKMGRSHIKIFMGNKLVGVCPKHKSGFAQRGKGVINLIATLRREHKAMIYSIKGQTSTRSPSTI